MKSVNSLYVVSCPLGEAKSLAKELERRLERPVRLSKNQSLISTRESKRLNHIWWGFKRQDGLWVEIRHNKGLDGSFEIEAHKDYEWVLFLRVNADLAIGNGKDPEQIQGWSAEVLTQLPYKSLFVGHPDDQAPSTGR